MEYHVSISACRKKGVTSRRFDVVINDSYCDMWVLHNDQFSSSFQAMEGSKVELELYHLTDIEELSEKCEFIAGEHVMTDAGAAMRIDLVRNDDAEEVYEQIEDDEIEQGWPKLSPNSYDLDDEQGELVLV